MSLFSNLFGKKKNEPAPDGADVFIETARLIANGDEAVIADVRKHMHDLSGYMQGQDFANRGLRPDMPQNRLCLFAMIDILINQGYAEEFDWKEESCEIMYGLEVIAKNLKLDFVPELALDFLDDGEDADNLEPERAFTLAALYTSRYRYHVACIDIDSDSYVVCLLSHKDFERCEKLLAGVDARIYMF